jgi:hypothetical protein
MRTPRLTLIIREASGLRMARLHDLETVLVIEPEIVKEIFCLGSEQSGRQQAAVCGSHDTKVHACNRQIT